MIDPELSLSFNIGTAKGTYALLLGSGISRNAGIPTGWEVTLDLVEKLAAMQGSNTSGNPVKWYQDTYGEMPDYSDVISQIAPKSASQQQLLKQYFEPTSDDEEGKKRPTRAHTAIAKMVRQNHIKVIITTNFDRLLEAALESEGISPVVISSPDGIKGAPPLAHSTCTVVKIHGDYLDHRIKNSPEALSKYSRPLNNLIDQIFDEYGLIVCGWSGEYDVALRDALLRRKSRRYPIYWAGFSKPTGVASDVINQLSAEFIKIEGADEFFQHLEEKLLALEAFNRPHPLTTQAAIATLKRYLSEPKHRISLHDFLMDEAIKAKSEFDKIFEVNASVRPSSTSITTIMKSCEAACERLMHLFAVGSLHAQNEHKSAFWAAFKHVSTLPINRNGYTIYNSMRRYPSLLICYATGFSSFQSGQFDILETISSQLLPKSGENSEPVVAPAETYVQKIINTEQARSLLEGYEQRHTPLSDYLRSLLGDLFGISENNDQYADQCFDEFEYLWCLLHVDDCLLNQKHLWTPYGSFAWRQRFEQRGWLKVDLSELLEADELANWVPLKAGFFGGDPVRLKAAIENSNDLLSQISNGLH